LWLEWRGPVLSKVEGALARMPGSKEKLAEDTSC